MDGMCKGVPLDHRPPTARIMVPKVTQQTGRVVPKMEVGIPCGIAGIGSGALQRHRIALPGELAPVPLSAGGAGDPHRYLPSLAMTRPGKEVIPDDLRRISS
jgi:hypothetical protein